MTIKNYKDGNVYQNNENAKQILLIDRSETTQTELSTWIIDGNSSISKKAYEAKELVFIPASGEATLTIDDKNFTLSKNDFLYLPANTPFLLANNKSEVLELIVFSAFLSEDKEGFSSFADFFASATEGKPAHLKNRSKAAPKLIRNYQTQKRYEFGSNSTHLMVCRSEAEACEVTVVTWPPHHKGAMVSHSEKEQTFFVISGIGWITVEEETKPVKVGDVIRIPFKAPHTTEAGDEELVYFCMNTIVTEETEPTFEEMYDRVAKGRIKRWESGDTTVGE